MSEPFTVQRLLDCMAHSRRLDEKVVIPVKSLFPSVGGSPCVEIERAYYGFDWNAGKFFLKPVEPVQAVGDTYDREKELARKNSDTLGWMWYILNSQQTDDAFKVREMKKLLKKKLDNPGASGAHENFKS